MKNKTFVPVTVIEEKYLIILIYKSQYELMYSLGRFQEFYENPILRGKSFSRLGLQNWQPDYYVKWSGCNFPYSNAKKFLALNYPDRHEREVLANLVPGKYIVGLYSSDKNMKSVLEHERAHAYYARFSSYRKELKNLLRFDKDHHSDVFDALLKMGYGENVLVDEYQAYLINGFEKLGVKNKETLFKRRVLKEKSKIS